MLDTITRGSVTVESISAMVLVKADGEEASPSDTTADTTPDTAPDTTPDTVANEGNSSNIALIIGIIAVLGIGAGFGILGIKNKKI